MEPTAQQMFSASLSINQISYDVQSFTGTEALNSVYCFKVAFSSSAMLFPETVLGKPAQLTLQCNDGQRVIHGLVYALRIVNAVTNHQFLLECDIRPRLSLLNLSGQAKVYPNQTIQELIDNLLQRHAVSGSQFYWRLGSRKLYQYPQWVQAQDETDFEFFERVLAREGINYLWDTSNSLEDSLSFVDQSYDLPSNLALAFYLQHQDGFLQHGLNSLYDLTVKDEAISYRVSYRDYDRYNPSKTIEKTAGSGARSVSYWGWGALDFEQLYDAATHHYQSLAMKTLLFGAKSQHPMLAAGHRIDVCDLPGFADGKYSVLEVEHHFENNHYHNRIRFIPEHVAIRPMLRKQQTGQLVHTAVIESSNDLPYLDQNGHYSYHSHIHNDEEGAVVSQQAVRLSPYGGKALDCAMGMHFPLKAQAEVLVMYLHNDLNQPLLQNSPANGLNHAPVTRDNSWSVLLKTAWGQYLEFCDRDHKEEMNLVNAQGRNYLKFEDQQDGEKITLAARGGSIILDAQAKQTIESDASIHQETAKDYRLVSQAEGRVVAQTIHLQSQEQQLKAAQNFDIRSGRHIEATAQNVSLESQGDLQIKAQGEWLQIELDNGDLLWQADHIELSSDEEISLSADGASLQLNQQGIALEAKRIHFDAGQLNWQAPVNYAADPAPSLSKQAAADSGRADPTPFYEHGFAKKITAPVWDKPFYYPGDTAYINLDIEGFQGDEPIELSLVRYHHDDSKKSLPSCPPLNELPGATEQDKRSYQLGDSSLYVYKEQAKESPGQAGLNLFYHLNHIEEQEVEQDHDPYYVKAQVGDVAGKAYSNPMVVLNQANITIEQDKDFAYKENEAILMVSRTLPEVLKSHPHCPPETSYNYHTKLAVFDRLPLGSRNCVSLRESHQYREIFNKESPRPHYKQSFKVSSKANAHTFKRVMRPMIFNLRTAEMTEDKSIHFRKEEPDARVMLRQEEIDYIKANGNNLTVFIHGYNVEHGQFDKHFSSCKLKNNVMSGNQLHTLTSDADATVFRDKEYILDQFPALKSSANNHEYDKVFDIEKINGSGMHEWVTFIEAHLNQAAGFKGKDYSRYSRCLFISWPGNPSFGLDYMSAVHESVRMGPIVAEVFKNLKKQIKGLKLHVITHSQGGGVMVHALNELGKQKNSLFKVDHAFLCQAAIPNNALSTYGIDSDYSPQYESIKKQQEHNIWFCPFAHKGAERISVLFSKNDNILGPVLKAVEQPQGVKIAEVYKRKPLYEYVPAKLLQALGGDSIYLVANFLGCPISDLLDPKKLQIAWKMLIKRFPEFSVNGISYACSKTLSGQIKLMDKLGLLGMLKEENFSERLLHSINELNKVSKSMESNGNAIKINQLPSILTSYIELALVSTELSSPIGKFISEYRPYIAKLWALVRSLYLFTGEKPKPAMGYEGANYKIDGVLFDMFAKGTLRVVDTTKWIWHHSDMKVGSEDIQNFVYKNNIIRVPEMVFGLPK